MFLDSFAHEKMKIKTILILISLFYFGGCSTFENSTVYMDRAQKLEIIGYANDIANLGVQFNPDLNFASMGMFGLPVIPLYVKISKTREVVLTMALKTYQNKFFSASVKPCLQTNFGEEFCPDHLKVSAIGMRDTSPIGSHEHRWEQVCNFRNIQDINIYLPKVRNEDKIDRTRVLQHYNCEEEDLDYLGVDYTYTYKCNGECPVKIILNVKDLISVDSLPIEDHNYVFEKTIDNNYRPIIEQLQ